MVKDAQLRAAAEKAAPEIRNHLERARMLHGALERIAASQEPSR